MNYTDVAKMTMSTKTRGTQPARERKDGVAAPIDLNITRIGNHIYFYEEITEKAQLILVQYLQECQAEIYANNVQSVLETGMLDEPIILHINSPGGHAHSGLALYDFIKTIKIPTVGVIEGFCASAATLLLLACKIRTMSPSSTFLMHQCSYSAMGQHSYMKDRTNSAEKLMQTLRKIYREETKIGEGKSEVERDAIIQNLLEHDIELTIDECRKMGIVASEEEDEGIELNEDDLKEIEAATQKIFDKAKKRNAAEKVEEISKKRRSGKSPDGSKGTKESKKNVEKSKKSAKKAEKPAEK